MLFEPFEEKIDFSAIFLYRSFLIGGADPLSHHTIRLSAGFVPAVGFAATAVVGTKQLGGTDMTFTWKGRPLTPALTEIEEGDGLNEEQRRILEENFVDDASRLTNPVAKLAFVNAMPVARAIPPKELHRPLLDPAKLEASGINVVEKLRLFEETKVVGIGIAERGVEVGLRTVSDAEFQAALIRVKPFLRD
jgi:hypothetical protein